MSRRDREGMPMGVLIVLVSLAAVLCIVLGTLMYLDNRALIRNKENDDKLTQEQARTDVLKDEQAPVKETQDEETGDMSESDEFYASLLPEDKKIDIAGLKNTVNQDIYAWLYIPETGIDEEVLQHPDDIGYYSTHNSEGQEDENGAIFTQMFNSKDFSDNVTVIYGHNGGNEKGFSKLNLYADPEFFKSHPYIFVYTEDAILLYETFAAYESDDKLIVLFYGTQDYDMYQIYLQRLKEIAGVNYNINEKNWPSGEDKILTLSTGVKDKDDRRFLVQARFVGGFIEDEDNE